MPELGTVFSNGRWRVEGRPRRSQVRDSGDSRVGRLFGYSPIINRREIFRRRSGACFQSFDRQVITVSTGIEYASEVSPGDSLNFSELYVQRCSAVKCGGCSPDDGDLWRLEVNLGSLRQDPSFLTHRGLRQAARGQDVVATEIRQLRGRF